ncbi:hypothetical protein [Methylocystis sp. SC2]|uniref:hypothetical protein n=1 Tax=Methylocystis sp. (strain SC2) TaxID=187303 RepID=UPI00027AECD3|nr:hypothetical protein [Methylocystis sp. SC2]CCJ08141.1 Hypothetical protein BN69_2690 [Methylocystis sp. SC2]
MTAVVLRLISVASLMFALLAAELAATFSFPGWGRSGVAVIAAAMVGIAAFGFMDLRQEGVVVRLFAAAALLWLVILLGLGALDPMTRTLYPTVIAVP